MQQAIISDPFQVVHNMLPPDELNKLPIAKIMNLANGEEAQGNLPDAVRYWAEIAKRPQTSEPNTTPEEFFANQRMAYFNIGARYAQQCTATNDKNEKIKFFQSALSALLPIHASAYRLPQTSLYLGILHENVAIFYLAAMQTEEQAEAIAPLFVEATKYYEVAASMDDYDNKKYPQTAANCLGCFYARGIGVEKDVEKAFAWHLKGAEGGWWEAQINVAVSLYLGRGTEQSLPQASEWLDKALPQIPENNPLKSEATYFLAQIARETGSMPSRPEALKVSEVLKDLAVKTPEL